MEPFRQPFAYAHIATMCAVLIVSNMIAVGAASAATASATDAYPSSSVPPGVRVSFIVTGTGFTTRPTFYLTDSFPGGATTANIDIGGNFSWTPNKDDIGTHGLTITLSDPDGNSASASRTITVIPAATITLGTPSPSAAVSMGTPISVQTTAAGFFSPTYSITDSMSGSSIANARINTAGVFSWTPLPQDVGNHTIAITAQDSYGTKATDSIDITVLTATALTIAALNPGTSVHASSTLTFSASPVGFVSPTITVIDDATGATPDGLLVDGTAVSWVPNPNSIGVHRLRVSAHDSGGRNADTLLTITVDAPLPPTAPPIIAAPEAQKLQAATPAPTIPPSTAPTTVPATKKATPTATPKTATTATPVPASIPTETPGTTTEKLAYPTNSEPLVPLLESQVLATSLVPQPQLSFVAFITHSIAAFFGGIFGMFGL